MLDTYSVFCRTIEAGQVLLAEVLWDLQPQGVSVGPNCRNGSTAHICMQKEEFNQYLKNVKWSTCCNLTKSLLVRQKNVSLFLQISTYIQHILSKLVPVHTTNSVNKKTGCGCSNWNRDNKNLQKASEIHDTPSHLANNGFVTLLNSKHMNLPPGFRTRRASCSAWKEKKKSQESSMCCWLF